MRRGGAKSFVDDLGWSRGVVLSRAATILRSIETQPFRLDDLFASRRAYPVGVLEGSRQERRRQGRCCFFLRCKSDNGYDFPWLLYFTTAKKPAWQRGELTTSQPPDLADGSGGCCNSTLHGFPSRRYGKATTARRCTLARLGRGEKEGCLLVLSVVIPLIFFCLFPARNFLAMVTIFQNLFGKKIRCSGYDL